MFSSWQFGTIVGLLSTPEGFAIIKGSLRREKFKLPFERIPFNVEVYKPAVARIINGDEATDEVSRILDYAKQLATKHKEHEAQQAVLERRYYEHQLVQAREYSAHQPASETFSKELKAYFDKQDQLLILQRTIRSRIRGAVVGALVASFVASATVNTFEFMDGYKRGSKALKHVVQDTVLGGICGGLTGSLAAAVEYFTGIHSGIQLVWVFSVVDLGQTAYKYLDGQITTPDMTQALFFKAIGMGLAISTSVAVTYVLGHQFPTRGKALASSIAASIVTSGARYVFAFRRKVPRRFTY